MNLDEIKDICHEAKDELKQLHEWTHPGCTGIDCPITEIINKLQGVIDSKDIATTFLVDSPLGIMTFTDEDTAWGYILDSAKTCMESDRNNRVVISGVQKKVIIVNRHTMATTEIKIRRIVRAPKGFYEPKGILSWLEKQQDVEFSSRDEGWM